MDNENALSRWWASLTAEQQAEARTIRSGPTPPPAWFTDSLAVFLRGPTHAGAYMMATPADAIHTIRRDVLEFIAAQSVPVD